jgi:hypothetical protein
MVLNSIQIIFNFYYTCNMLLLPKCNLIYIQKYHIRNKFENKICFSLFKILDATHIFSGGTSFKRELLFS